ncbi:MAG: GNAT family N-acetyltransferase [Thiothrix sp.]
MSLTITPATLADIPALCRLLDRLFTQEAEFQSDRAAQERGLTAIISQPHVGHILVARQDDETVGMVNLLYTVSTALGGRVALLEDMVIASEVRGQGVGSTLLAAAIDHARQQGCLRITLLTDLDNHVAQAFYRKQGFNTSAMMPMRLMLPPA